MKDIKVNKEDFKFFNERIKKLNSLKAQKDELEKEIKKIQDGLKAHFDINPNIMSESVKLSSNAWGLNIALVKESTVLDSVLLKKDEALYRTLLCKYGKISPAYIRFSKIEKVTNNK